jgi:hypothetical protein
MVVSRRNSLVSFYFDQNKDFLGLYFKSKISFANWFLVQQKNRGLELKVVCNGLDDILQNTRRDELKKELNRTKDSNINDENKKQSESKRGY